MWREKSCRLSGCFLHGFSETSPTSLSQTKQHHSHELKYFSGKSRAQKYVWACSLVRWHFCFMMNKAGDAIFIGTLQTVPLLRIPDCQDVQNILQVFGYIQDVQNILQVFQDFKTFPPWDMLSRTHQTMSTFWVHLDFQQNRLLV